MDFDEKKFLKDHTGFCLFPVGPMDPETGLRKKLCDAMTFQENGEYPPFCKEHTQEVRKIMAYRKTVAKTKKQGFRGALRG